MAIWPTVTPAPGASGSRIRVENAVFLNVGAGADDDRLVIAPDHRAEPDAGPFLDLHPADDRGIGRNPIATGSGKFGGDAIDGIQRHAASSELRIVGDYTARPTRPERRAEFEVGPTDCPKGALQFPDVPPAWRDAPWLRLMRL